MNRNKKISLFIYFGFLLISNGLAFFSFPGYSILKNTTSHLGAQGSPNGWIMNIVFVSLGIESIWIALQTKIRYHQFFGVIFGLSLVMTGIFQHAPLITSIPVNHLQDILHSLFASITGFSFTLLAAGHGFMSDGSQRIVGIFMAMLAIFLSFAMFSVPEIMGLLQRIMFLSAFGWLFFYMKIPLNKQAKFNKLDRTRQVIIL
ncbi:MAG: hypothetical protein FD133_1511 [Erysipelotrichaceae bacterium]|nr:MAG: hypothetical protein FD179_1990 [Erysipelotrichaceae bacterium]TXT17154.1 MAG: hypothetical protein FD133_1511 [Erysipelotrichaceae bacterium]